jgi:outer membrane immunogenic protein
MKKFILAATAIVSAAALTTTAKSADVVPAGYDWSGFYFGLNAGVAWNNSELENDLKYTGTDDIGPYSPEDVNDFLNEIDGNSVGGDEAVFTGGAMLGYNWQMDSLVLGVEADINYAGFGDDNRRDIGGALSDVLNRDIEGSTKASFDANWFGTLRGRLGFAADNFLFYGTGGLAYGNMEANVDLDVTDIGTGNTYSYNGSTESTNWGWTIGAGMEYGIDNWSLGIEYLYVDLGSAEWDGNWGSNDNVNFDTTEFDGNGDIDYQFSVVRATAKIRF